jgi:hypothetical protein
VNRYVVVPASHLINGLPPDEALQIAKTFSLEIKIDESAEKIEIVSEPRIKEIFHEKEYEPNKVWSLDIHDEFVDMSGECFLKTGDEIFYPKIKEKHIIKFRIRHKQSQEKVFSVFINEKEYFSSIIFER